MLILISGPYRSGTNDDPQLMKRNLEKLEAVALPLFRLGHVPVIGEWLALPLLHLAGSQETGDAAYQEISYPIAHRILLKCDAVLRIEGPSKGADEDVRIAIANGLTIYFNINDVPAEKMIQS